MSGLPWTGNVRQLENVCHYLMVMAPGQVIEAGDLPPDLSVDEKVLETEGWAVCLSREADAKLARGETAILNDLVPAFEEALIRIALKHTGGRRIEAAHLLGWGRNTLTRKIQELGMETGESDSGQ
jgi:two-component system nitrogen regulation response regulator GlnG